MKQLSERFIAIVRRVFAASAVILVFICLGGCGTPTDTGPTTIIVRNTATGERTGVEERIITVEIVVTAVPSTALSNSPNPTNAAAGTPPSPADSQTNQLPVPAGDLATVTRIIDGDTIEVALGGTNYRVRYIGMDTPERGDFFFSEATEANRVLVEGQEVVLVKDVSETDRYGRLLRYVYLADGTFVNAELVRQGYAVIATFPPDVRHQEMYLQLEREARAAGRGLWAQPSGNGPLPTNAPAATNPPQPSNCDPAYPTVCIPPPPPDLDCGEIPYRDFTVLPADPHNFDGDNDGIGCET